MLRNLGIRWQILSAIALPVLVLGMIFSQLTYRALTDLRRADQSVVLARSANGFAELADGLGTERALSVAVLQDEPGASQRLRAVRSNVDRLIRDIRSRVPGDADSDLLGVLNRSTIADGQLGGLRADVDAGRVEWQNVAARYTQVIDADVDVPSELSDILSNRAEAANFRHFGELSRASEALSQETLIGVSVIRAGRSSTADQRALGFAEATQQQALAAFGRTASPVQQAGLRIALAGPRIRAADLTLARAAFHRAGTTYRPDVKLADWTAIGGAQLGALSTVRRQVGQNGVDLAVANHDTTRTTLLLTLGGGLVITLLTLLMALAMSRRISAPLRRLTATAGQIRDQLPRIVESIRTDETAEVEVELPVVSAPGRNEVGQLAAAFADVNAVTVEIARDQARLRSAFIDMFVNVARRNQVLLGRQLAFIDHLERNEANPDGLEDLFRLDHLATRMRRNAESLLVLAGIESGRRLRDPMPLSDVVRTATSEIEHYSRVSLTLAVDPPVFAHLALPVAHLLAELLENATNFSDPGSSVAVLASVTEHGVRMTVADDGLGISDPELAAINARIEEPPTAEALGSQRLGFFVVGRLAKRLNAKVTLTSGRARGTAVLIDLPASLFVPGSLDDLGLDRPSSAGQPMAPPPGPIPTALPPGAEELAGSRDEVEALAPVGIAEPLQPPEPVRAPVTAVPFVTAFATEAGPTSTATISIPLPSSPLPLPASFNVDELDDGTEPRWTPPVAAGSLAEVPVQRGTEPDAEPSTEPDAEPDTEPRTEQDAEPNTELASDAPHTPAVIRQAYALAAPHDPGNIPAQGPTDGASQPTPGRAESLFSGFRSRRDARDAAPVEQSIGLAPPVSEATLAPIARPEPPPLEPIALLEPIPPPQPAPPNLDDWFDAAAAMGADAPGWEPWEEDLGPQDTADDPQQAADDPQQAADDTQEPADEPRSATLTAPFNILPQRTSIRTALGRGRRRRSEQQSGSADAPFSGGFDLLGPARDFAQQEGFGPSVDSGTQPVSTGLPTQPNGVPAVAVATAGSPIPSQARESSSGRARGSVGDDALQGDRSALTSQALTELSRLSAYNPTSLPPADRGGLERRTPAAPAPPQPEAEVETSGQRARTAADVRSMLTGFNAGVERGRTSPSAHRPASERPPEEEVRADQPESAGSATGRSEADRIAHGQPVSDQSTGDQPLGVEPAADPSAPRPPRKGAWGSLPQRRHTDPGARDE